MATNENNADLDFLNQHFGNKPPAKKIPLVKGAEPKAAPKSNDDLDFLNQHFGKPSAKPKAVEPEKKSPELKPEQVERYADIGKQTLDAAKEKTQEQKDHNKNLIEQKDHNKNLIEQAKSLPMRAGIKLSKATMGMGAIPANELAAGAFGYVGDALDKVEGVIPGRKYGAEASRRMEAWSQRQAEGARKQYSRLAREEAQRYGKPGVVGQTVDSLLGYGMAGPVIATKTAAGPLGWGVAEAIKSRGRGEAPIEQAQAGVKGTAIGAAFPIVGKYAPKVIAGSKRLIKKRMTELDPEVLGKTAPQQMSARQLRAEGYKPFAGKARHGAKNVWVKKDASGNNHGVEVSPEVAAGKIGWVKKVAKEAWQSLKEAPGEIYQRPPKPAPKPKLLKGKAPPPTVGQVETVKAQGRQMAVDDALVRQTQANGLIKGVESKLAPVAPAPVLNVSHETSVAKPLVKKATPKKKLTKPTDRVSMLSNAQEQDPTITEEDLRYAALDLSRSLADVQGKGKGRAAARSSATRLEKYAKDGKEVGPRGGVGVMNFFGDEIISKALEIKYNERWESGDLTEKDRAMPDFGAATNYAKPVAAGTDVVYNKGNEQTIPKVKQEGIAANRTEPRPFTLENLPQEAGLSPEDVDDTFLRDNIQTPAFAELIKSRGITEDDITLYVLDKIGDGASARIAGKKYGSGQSTATEYLDFLNKEIVAVREKTQPAPKTPLMKKAATPALADKINKSTAVIYKARSLMKAEGGTEYPTSQLEKGETFTMTGDKRLWKVTAENKALATKTIEDGAPVTWSNNDTLPIDDFKESEASLSGFLSRVAASNKGSMASDLFINTEALAKHAEGVVGVVKAVNKYYRPHIDIRDAADIVDGGYQLAQYESWLTRKRLRELEPDVEKRIAASNAIEANEVPPELEAIVTEAKARFKDNYDFAVANGVEVGFIEDYVTHVWKNPEMVSAAYGLRTRSGGMKSKSKEQFHRKIPSIADGKELGFEPLTEDVADLVAINERSLKEVITRNRMIDTLQESGIIRTLAEVVENVPAEELSLWVSLEDQSISSKLKSEDDLVILRSDKSQVDRLFAPSDAKRSMVMRVMLDLQAIAKRSLFELNPFFHGVALAKSTAFNPADVNFMKGLKLYNEGHPDAKEAIASGVKIGPPDDMGAAEIKGLIEGISDLTPLPGWILKKVQDFTDEILWNKVFLGFKVNTYISSRDALRKHYGKTIKDSEIQRWAAIFSNEIYGGLNNRKAMKSADLNAFLRLLLLAPDWTLSNLKSGTGLFRGYFEGQSVIDETVLLGDGGKDGGQDPSWKGKAKRRLKYGNAAGYAYRRYWRNIILALGTTVQMINYANTMRDSEDGKGRFTWENENPERRLDAYVYTDEDGGKHYVDLLGFLKDNISMMVNPTEFFYRKGAHVPKMMYDQARNETWQGVPITYEYDSLGTSLYKRIKYASGVFTPISVSTLVGTQHQDKPAIERIATVAGFPFKDDRDKTAETNMRHLGINKWQVTRDIYKNTARIEKGYITAEEGGAKNTELMESYNKTADRVISDMSKRFGWGYDTDMAESVYSSWFIIPENIEAGYTRFRKNRKQENRRSIMKVPDDVLLPGETAQ